MPEEITEALMPPRQTVEEFSDEAEKIKDHYVHALTFTFRDGVPDAEVDHALGMLEDLGTLPGVQALMIRESVDKRKGRTVLELAIFDDGPAYLAFRQHPKHLEFANVVKEIADWVAVDFEGAERVVDTVLDIGKVGLGGVSPQTT